MSRCSRRRRRRRQSTAREARQWLTQAEAVRWAVPLFGARSGRSGRLFDAVRHVFGISERVEGHAAPGTSQPAHRPSHLRQQQQREHSMDLFGEGGETDQVAGYPEPPGSRGARGGAGCRDVPGATNAAAPGAPGAVDAPDEASSSRWRPCAQIYVSGLPRNVTEEELGTFFGQIGLIKQDKKKRKPQVQPGEPRPRACWPPAGVPTRAPPMPADLALPGQGHWAAQGRCDHHV